MLLFIFTIYVNYPKDSFRRSIVITIITLFNQALLDGTHVKIRRKRLIN